MSQPAFRIVIAASALFIVAVLMSLALVAGWV